MAKDVIILPDIQSWGLRSLKERPRKIEDEERKKRKNDSRYFC